MAKTLGYMITWTTYGTWLQGDDRGFVKNGKILTGNQALYEASKARLSDNPFTLTSKQRQAVRRAILDEAQKLGQKVFALAVSSNHVHMVVEYFSKPIGRIVAHYKNAARLALCKMGNKNRLWTRRYDKRYCFDRRSLEKRIAYVKRHRT